MENQIPKIKTSSASKKDYDSGFSLFTLRFGVEEANAMIEQLGIAVQDGEKFGGIVVNLSFGQTGEQKYPSGDIFIRGKLPRSENPVQGSKKFAPKTVDTNGHSRQRY